MTIQPMINLNDEYMQLMTKIAVEHDVTIEEYLSRICQNHIRQLLSLDQEGYLKWTKV